MTKHTATPAFTASELLSVMASRLLKDGQIVFAGVGIPLLAATLAQRNFAPHLTILFEGGTIGPFIVPGELPPSTNEQRCTRRANMVLPITDVLLLLQRGYVDVGFMGGAQIDRFGNLNTTYVGPPDRALRLPGSGGAPDIASLARRHVVIMAHERRRFVERVDYVTSPGYGTGGDWRARTGLPGGGPSAVITTLGLFRFDPATREMELASVHPGVPIETVQAETGWPLRLADPVRETVPPRADELAMIRRFDPEGFWTRPRR